MARSSEFDRRRDRQVQHFDGFPVGTHQIRRHRVDQYGRRATASRLRDPTATTADRCGHWPVVVRSRISRISLSV